MNVVLISGVNGFLGRYIAHQFALSDWVVAGIGTRPPENSPQNDLSHYFQLTLPSQELISIFHFLKPSLCIHCAGRSSVEYSFSNPDIDFESSTLITFNLLNSLRLTNPCCHFIYLSSAAVYGNPSYLPISEATDCSPISPYGYHKWISEILCKEFHQLYSLPITIVRIFSAYGVGLRRQVIWDICYKLLTQSNVTLQGTGNETRDFIHAFDVAKAIYCLAKHGDKNACIYNLASGLEVSIQNLVDFMLTKINFDGVVEFNGLVPQGSPSNWCADIARIESLGFKSSVAFQDGLSSSVLWCQSEIRGY